ncbi:hypothetical protein [Streptomyces flavidovirens]|uniref:Transposase n=1 Tax=Streptomyces flavidovirens TaxID=67298 RepID=A0ABW6RIF0_9ACTN
MIRLEVEHPSKDRAAPAVWLWSSKTAADDADVDRAWQAFLRRFDLEHTFRLFKQTLGWTRPQLREPESRPVDLADHRPHRAGSPRPRSAGRFGTSANTCPG